MVTPEEIDESLNTYASDESIEKLKKEQEGEEVLGDIAEEICGARVCTISGNTTEARWTVSYQGGNGYTETKVSVERIFNAFDPERVNDKKRLEEEP